jgi:ADP-ribosylglycohydrolase
MRVSPCGWIGAGSLECAKISAEVTHNHPEGIKGAQAVVMAIIVARRGGDRGLIYSKVRYHYKYDLSESVDSIREWYKFDETCQGTAPQAICCALQAVDFEDAIRNAISIGGDSDTVAAITGSIAEAMFGIPEGIREKAISYLPDAMVEVVDRFVEHVRAERGFIYV